MGPSLTESANSLFYRENKEKNVVILLINEEAVQLASHT